MTFWMCYGLSTLQKTSWIIPKRNQDYPKRPGLYPKFRNARHTIRPVLRSDADLRDSVEPEHEVGREEVLVREPEARLKPANDEDGSTKLFADTHSPNHVTVLSFSAAPCALSPLEKCRNFPATHEYTKAYSK